MFFCFQHAACALLGEETDECVTAARREEGNADGRGEGLLLTEAKDGNEVFADGGADGKERVSGRGGAGEGEERF